MLPIGGDEDRKDEALPANGDTNKIPPYPIVNLGPKARLG